MKPALMELVEAELSKPYLRRNSPEVRSLYNAEREAPRKRDARFTMWVTIVLYMAFAGLDFVLIPDMAVSTATGRAVVSAIALAVIEALVRRGARADHVDATCAGLVVVGYLTWLVFASCTEHVLSFSYYMVFGTIFMMVANLLFNFRPKTSIVASCIIMLGFFTAMQFAVHVSPSYAIAFGVFYVSCFAFNFYMNWKLNAERYSVFLNALQSRIQQDELTEQGKTLLRLSNTDPLTGLANRRAIDEKLRGLWREWQFDGKPFAAILIDIDFFKRFNDYYGHQEGDCTLVLVTGALADLAHAHDASIGRYGGEEFIILVQSENRTQVAAFAETIRETIADLRIAHEYRRDGEAIITISVGAAFTTNASGAKLERLISEADRALYGAKASGRNCVQVFDPNVPHVSDVSENIAALLRIAVPQQLVSLVYQPIEDVASGTVEAVEALMRLKMLDGTAISPAVFIPVAERTGAIHELGRWAIRTACRELLVGKQVPVVSVNISAVQLQAPGFSASVAAILGEMGIMPDRLAFEITEGLEIETHPDILRCIGELQQLGIRIWLDDFGTGFAGLSWLRLIKFDMVKIDRSFLHDSVLPEGAEMFRDIIGLIRNRGHRMIVEGIETEQQMELVRHYEVDQVQGFYIGRPAPARDFCKTSASPARMNLRRSLNSA